MTCVHCDRKVRFDYIVHWRWAEEGGCAREHADCLAHCRSNPGPLVDGKPLYPDGRFGHEVA